MRKVLGVKNKMKNFDLFNKILSICYFTITSNRCRFLPTCSEYFIEAVKTKGLTKGVKLGVIRILKCHPFKQLGGSYGLDFVPISKGKKDKNNG